MKKIIEYIASIPLFHGLQEQHYKELAMIVTDQEFGKGAFIFAEGDAGSGFYVIIEGKVKIFKLSFEGKEQILHVLGPGEPFAEVAVFAGSTYPANAVALEKSRLFFFPRKEFADLITRQPGLAMNMLAALSLRLKQFAHMIETLSLKEVPSRLAAYILVDSGRNQAGETMNLAVSKAQLASLLGTIPETLSRILARMNKRKLIKINGGAITILDREALTALAEGELRL
jgi:CRP/FNR family transcriptional regulator, dissimilatory nitrate respiration regulator